ncbi:MAG: 30S ribosomal protein S4e [Candidatus Aenigmatarchaeota archaeon]
MVVMKRQVSPFTWPIERKSDTYVVVPKGGAIRSTLPVCIAVRDMLRYADNVRELKSMINRKIIRVDGKLVKDYSNYISIMGILTIGTENFRLLPTKKGYGLFSPENDVDKKLLKIVNKTVLRGNKIQLNFHDGRNLIIEKDSYKTGDVVVFDLNSKKLIDVVECKRGALVIITDGKNRGVIGKLEKIITVRNTQQNRVLVKSGEKKIETLKDYVFVIGVDKPVIDMGDVVV